MSWSVSAFLLLFAALAAGFVWYERSRPPAKLVALVAALAALAVAGRVAFAPIPNVKPTTDIIILAGFALGAAPGFTVGAVTALASNVLFGQGPWTPWQMVAWGLCGVAGALLGRATGRSLGRWPLAAFCGLAGLAFGAIMDLSTWTTYTGAHSLQEYLVISATSLPFNVAHAAGNVIFCAAFGPAFLRALLRYRERFTVRWQPVAAAGLVALGLLVGTASAGPSAATATAAPVAHPAASTTITRAVAYLRRSQNRDGGFGSAPGRRSAALYTAWAAMAFGAAGVKATTVRHGGPSLAARLRADARGVASAGDLERTILAFDAVNLSTKALGARLRRLPQSDGSFVHLANLTSFGVLALRASGTSAKSRLVTRAVKWLEKNNAGGRFSFSGKNGSLGFDDTAAAAQALRAGGLGPGAGTLSQACRALRDGRAADGGWGQGILNPDPRSNSQSTSWVVQAYGACALKPNAKAGRARSPLAFLRTLQVANGSVRYDRTSAQTPVWTTSQVLLALTERSFPISLSR